MKNNHVELKGTLTRNIEVSRSQKGNSFTKFNILGNLQTSSYKKDDQKIYSMNAVVESFELLNE